MLWDKDVFLGEMPGEIAVRILEEYLLRGWFLVKLQASSIFYC